MLFHLKSLMLFFLSVRTEHEVFWFILKYKIKEREERQERQLSFDFSASYCHMTLVYPMQRAVVCWHPACHLLPRARRGLHFSSLAVKNFQMSVVLTSSYSSGSGYDESPTLLLCCQKYLCLKDNLKCGKRLRKAQAFR